MLDYTCVCMPTLYVFNVPTLSYLSNRGTAVPVRCFLLAAEYPGGHDEFFTGPPSNSFCLPASLPPPPPYLTHVPLVLSL